MSRFLDWLEDRTGYRTLFDEALYERIPGGSRWRYVWGSTLVFTFAVQVITGLFLWTAYSPSTQTAWESVFYIQEVMQWGWLVRGLHHFAAQAMVVLLALHFAQVVVDGAYKAPREVNFWLGLILMQIVLGLALTGYLLPWDQKGYYATKVATKIMGATPLIGPELQQLVQGGSEYGHHTLTRFFALHAGILPVLLVLFLVLHLHAFRRHGVTVPNPDRAPETTFWPDQVLKDGVACLAVLAVVLFLAVREGGAPLSAPADPADSFDAARPEWYFLFLFRFLKFEWVEHFGLAFGAIYLPGLVMLLFVLMPLLSRLGWGHRFNVAFMAVVMVGALGLTIVAFYEDLTNPEHQAALAAAERDAERVKQLAEVGDPEMFGVEQDAKIELSEESNIPLQGAVYLKRNDPWLQGPRIFADNCSACHTYNGHNGLGKKPQEPPVAADLGTFGTRDWVRSVLTDYSTLFEPLTHAQWYRKAKDAGEDPPIDPAVVKDEDGDWIGGQMAVWSATHAPLLKQDENARDYAALVETLFAESGRDDANVDEALVERGKEIIESYELTSGELEMSCTDCHYNWEPGRGFELAYEQENAAGPPTLNGYMSQAWLKDFVRNPGAEHFYGENNQMPAYDGKLSEKELDLLVRWMLGDYLPPSEEVQETAETAQELQQAAAAAAGAQEKE